MRLSLYVALLALTLVVSYKIRQIPSGTNPSPVVESTENKPNLRPKVGKFRTPNQLTLTNGCMIQVNRDPVSVPSSQGDVFMYRVDGLYSVGECPNTPEGIRPQKGDAVFESDIVKAEVD